ncbi:MAG: hypothetical protein M0036_19195 [Desulfobacteraceae bacterium]|nr:hypothetical protein [Desulfobacteraceae bacterium]
MPRICKFCSKEFEPSEYQKYYVHTPGYCPACWERQVHTIKCRCNSSVSINGFEMEQLEKGMLSATLCRECWEEEEDNKEAERCRRAGWSEAFGPGPAVFDGSW